jgi:ABC-2 type transport system ATP-binding protein
MLALSGGETRRVDLACTLMGSRSSWSSTSPRPAWIPESRREVWRSCPACATAAPRCSSPTHYLEEAEALADRLEIMHAGRFVRSGTPTEIEAGYPSTIDCADVTRLPDLAGIRPRSSESTVERPGDRHASRPRCPTAGVAALNDVERGRSRRPQRELVTVFLSIADSQRPGRQRSSDP